MNVTDPNTSSEHRLQAAFDETALAGAHVPPAHFEQIAEVIQLSRKLAMKNYFTQLSAVIDAPDADTKRQAVADLAEAERAARLADSAFQSFMAAQADVRASAVSLLHGDREEAVKSATQSGQHLEVAADKLTRFGDYAPRSRAFQSAMNAVARADELAGRLEQGATRTVAAFSQGLKSFSERIRSLGKVVIRTPDIVATVAATTKASVAEVTRAAVASFSSRLGAAADATWSKVRASKNAARETAWSLIDDATDWSVRAKSQVSDIAGAIDIHARATVGLAGGILANVSTAACAAKGASTDSVPQPRAQRLVRKPTLG